MSLKDNIETLYKTIVLYISTYVQLHNNTAKLIVSIIEHSLTCMHIAVSIIYIASLTNLLSTFQE